MEEIGSRRFAVGDAEVKLTIGKPEQQADGDYVCAYTISFLTQEWRSSAVGVDSVQALFLAMQKAHVDLLASEEYQHQGLNWLKTDGLGLPLAPGIRIEDFDDLPPEQR